MVSGLLLLISMVAQVDLLHQMDMDLLPVAKTCEDHDQPMALDLPIQM
jgi:hypothetical protein